MLQALVNGAGRLVQDLRRSILRPFAGQAEQRAVAARPARQFLPLKRVLLTDDVGRTLFEEYAAHQASSRGEEETGWVLLGLREEEEALVLATLPAGAGRDAGVGHVQFNSCGQVVGSRIVR